jgi:hypothetical protein
VFGHWRDRLRLVLRIQVVFWEILLLLGARSSRDGSNGSGLLTCEQYCSDHSDRSPIFSGARNGPLWPLNPNMNQVEISELCQVFQAGGGHPLCLRIDYDTTEHNIFL